MMPDLSKLRDWLNAAVQVPLLDVRSPGEFEHGHIPGAVSFPLFSDEERAEVGTVYKQVSKESAVELGLRFVGPKMEQFVLNAKQIAPEKKVLVHCWRGGQRSASMAWLLKTAGFEAEVVPGGYKSYRQMVQDGLQNTPLKLLVLGGQTGSGKTKILHKMAEYGEQVIDLEGLANHKGSAFGAIGERPQPSVEQFENDLFSKILSLDLSKRVWLENESHSIGRVFIPEGFWAKLRNAPLVNIQIPLEARINNLLEDYVLEHKQDLVNSFQKIDKKLGGLEFKKALEALENNDFATAAKIALVYYDKTYQYGLENNSAPSIQQLAFEKGDAGEIARRLMELGFYS
jgi:tRNA 2-selenouridine synthase